ncbi:MAG: hypothetical protein GY874_20135 [Desulfobacteraceae bacterium]|nr:hypothetical protein [Desulfobacteraceae bacterium]
MQIDFLLPFFNRLAQVYAQMDQAYHAAAAGSGFDCAGCKDNCCLTRFYHHTYIECLYFKNGLDHLPDQIRQQIAHRSHQACKQMQTQDQQQGCIPKRIMCPLNVHGRCELYEFRPLICRLHGIPHVLRRPDGVIQTGSGCHEFHRRCGDADQIRLDRTPHYRSMSKLEQQVRMSLGVNQKLKLTVAQIVISDILAGNEKGNTSSR